MPPYERFDAWKLCHRLNIAVCRASRGWGGKGFSRLMWQAQSAAWSAPANIVEGSAKRGSKEFRRFLDISLGSLAEISYALRVARDLDLISAEEWNRMDSLRQEASKTTWALYRSVQKPVGHSLLHCPAVRLVRLSAWSACPTVRLSAPTASSAFIR